MTHAIGDTVSAVLAWLGPKATGFGLALSGLGLPDLQAKPTWLALAWLWLGLAHGSIKFVYYHMAHCTGHKH